MDLLDRARELVAMWRPRLGIAEVINVEVVSDGDSSERELEARCIPVERDGEGYWVFTIQVGDTIEADRLERAIVHELVHVLMEPLRERYLKSVGDDEHPSYVVRGISGPEVLRQIADTTRSGMVFAVPDGGSVERLVPEGRLQTWETCIDRLADGFLRAYTEVAVA